MAKNMYDFYKDAYSEIKGKMPERPYLDKQMSLPIYEGYSVANLPASICNWLGSENTGMLPPLAFEKSTVIAFGISSGHSRWSGRLSDGNDPGTFGR